MAWSNQENVQQDITACQEQKLPISTRAQRAPTVTKLDGEIPGNASLVLEAHFVPVQVGIAHGLSTILGCLVSRRAKSSISG